MPGAEQDLILDRATVVASEEVAEGIWRMRLHAPHIARRAEPGQFVMLGPSREDTFEPFLNRPLSIHRRPGTGDLELLIAVVGRGTQMLTRLLSGDTVLILGPVGRPFRVPETARQLILVAGGLGIAPLCFLAEEAAALPGKPVVELLYGARTRSALIPMAPIEQRGVQIRLSTDDGSFGMQGTVVDLLSSRLAEVPEPMVRSTYLAACGPRVMSQAVYTLARRYPVQVVEVSLENRMACGVGACMGCTIFLADGRPQRVCCDGPVFAAAEVFGE